MKKILISAIALATVAMAGAQTQTEKRLVITDKEGKTVSYKASDVEGVIFQAAPEYIDVNTLLVTSYEESGELGLYRLDFGMSAPDENGDPVNVGDVQVGLLLAGPWSDDLSKPILPAGYYRVGNGTEQWTFDVTKSAVWARAEEGKDGVTLSAILDGTVDVRKTGDQYDIRMELTTLSGPLDLRYQGDLPFTAGMGEYEDFTENLNLNFTRGQGRFYGSWFYPFAADLTVQFFDATIEDGYFKDGYILEVSMFEPKPADCMAANQRIADGTYSVDARESVSYNAYSPYTYQAGKRLDFMGTEYIVRTRLEYTAPDGHRKLGLITDGTFTVSENGTKFVFDFVTDKGISIKGTYNGTPNLGNYCDNDENEPKRPYSTIAGNVDLSWAAGTTAVSYNEGRSILEDANTLTFMVCVPNMDRGQYLQFVVLSEDEMITDGTYDIDWNLASGNALPGTVDFAGVPIFSWYGDLDTTDDEGYQTDLACISAGTVKVSSNADGTKKIVFDLTDDAGKKITGEYNGALLDITPEPDAISKIKKAAERHVKSMKVSRVK